MRAGLILVAVIAGLCAPAAAQEAEPPSLVAANFHSRFCGPCLVIDVRMDRIEPDYSDSAVEFITFDLTFGRRARVRARAEAAGIADIYDQASRAQGFILLIDRRSGRIFDTITAADDEMTIRHRLDRAIHFTSRPK